LHHAHPCRLHAPARDPRPATRDPRPAYPITIARPNRLISHIHRIRNNGHSFWVSFPVIKRFPVLNQSVSLDSYRETLNYRNDVFLVWFAGVFVSEGAGHSGTWDKSPEPPDLSAAPTPTVDRRLAVLLGYKRTFVAEGIAANAVALE
jgi:hypothetical protein